MGALRWDSEDARFCIENRFTLFARFCRLQIGRAKHGDNLARSLFVQPKHAQDKSCGLTAEIQARIERGQSRGGRDDVSRETILGFSVRQAAARPVSPPLCHSDAPTQSYCQRRIFALDLQAVVSVGRQSSFLLRESSDYNCGCMMKRKDSSSQAPQNDKEKRNAGAAALNGEMFHVKQFIIHHSEF